MLDNGKMSARQFAVLVTFFSIGTSILVIPTGQAQQAGSDAWISSLIGILFCVIIVILYIYLSRLFGERSFICYLENTLGKWIGKSIGLLFVFFCFIGTTTNLPYIGYFLTTNILTSTPMIVIHIIFFICVIYAVQLGIEVIARTAEIFFPWFMLLFTIFCIFLMPDINIEKIQPILQTDLISLIKAGFYLASYSAMPAIVFFIFFPNKMNTLKGSQLAFLIGMISGGLIITVVVFLCISVLGPKVTANLSYPSYSLGKIINVGDIVQRIEVIIAVMWFFSIFFKMAIYFYGCVVGLAEILELKEYRTISWPLAIFVIVFSVIVYPNYIFMNDWDGATWPPYVLTIGIVLPILLVLVDRLRAKTSKQSA
ncbi:GerAB/ArcD/ProY family transporter [Alkalihalobacterium alkalinitrilicum]|uniref:GerAB/ArcD/ProY family transporter n=1 Tax=Alkalihalobacterium alkalinitrilicum TaxID=427920 RepID=UPI001303AADC|nr:endospore germination permease [Alkalihalobacterium alkalinitrilicum]